MSDFTRYTSLTCSVCGGQVEKRYPSQAWMVRKGLEKQFLETVRCKTCQQLARESNGHNETNAAASEA